MLSTERNAPVSFPQLSMESCDFTRSPDHEISSPCKGIQLPGMKMQRREPYDKSGNGSELYRQGLGICCSLRYRIGNCPL